MHSTQNDTASQLRSQSDLVLAEDLNTKRKSIMDKEGIKQGPFNP